MFRHLSPDKTKAKRNPYAMFPHCNRRVHEKASQLKRYTRFCLKCFDLI